MTIGERIRRIRKDNSLTMEKFGARIGIKQNSLSLLESGRNNPSDQTILSICREFHVDPDWLRTGEGEPYRTRSKEQELAALFADVTWEDSLVTRLVSALARLTPEDLAELERIAKKMLEGGP